jgi:hypothetical protein
MTKLILKYVLFFLLIEVVLFLLGSACSVTFNMNKWQPITFTLFCCLSGFAFIFTAIAAWVGIESKGLGQ